jgi:preprotein translocase subunit SecE
LSLFISQILDELRKVVRPTRSELVNYTIVVIVFVSFVMALVSALDYAFTKLVLWVFGG